MKSFKEYINEENKDSLDPLFPVNESEDSKRLRLSQGLKVFVILDAKKMKEFFEKHEGEPLVHKPHRIKRIKEIIEREGAVDSFPHVSAIHSPLSISDGRHRIAVAAENKQKIQVATTMSSITKLARFK